MQDNSNPSHYKKNSFEVIDVICSITMELNNLPSIQNKGFIGFCLGNAIKYLLRCCMKGDFIGDIKKAIWYLNKILEIVDHKYDRD
jgi:hypothetical protein